MAKKTKASVFPVKPPNWTNREIMRSQQVAIDKEIACHEQSIAQLKKQRADIDAKLQAGSLREHLSYQDKTPANIQKKATDMLKALEGKG